MLCHLCIKVLPRKKKTKTSTTQKNSVFIVEEYFKINKSLAAAVCNFHARYGQNSDFICEEIGVIWSLRFIPTSPWSPMPWRRLSAVLTKFSHTYAKQPWKISTKECVCASKAVEAIYMTCYSVHNPMLCTLWINEEVTIFNYKHVFCQQYCLHELWDTLYDWAFEGSSVASALAYAN